MSALTLLMGAVIENGKTHYAIVDGKTTQDAVWELAQLQENLEKANARLVELGMTMPCGHLARYAVNVDEGTQYCVMCVLEATQLTIINLVNEDEQ